MLKEINTTIRTNEQVNLYFDQIVKLLELTYNNSEVYISINSSKMSKDNFEILFIEEYTTRKWQDRFLIKKFKLKHMDEKHAIYLFEKIGEKLSQKGHILWDFPGRGTKHTIKMYKIT